MNSEPSLRGMPPEPETNLCTLTVLIPRYYNAELNGFRRKIEWGKLRLTLSEMHLLFGGYTATASKGWNREDNVRDQHLQFQIDFVPSHWHEECIRSWKKILERRFHQRALYMKLTNGGRWL